MSQWRWILTLVLLSIGAGGCAAASTCEVYDEPVESPANLLFGGNTGTERLATHIGRRDWPATDNGYSSTEWTGFREVFYDYQGNQFQELNNPRRYFTSYRAGIQQR